MAGAHLLFHYFFVFRSLLAAEFVAGSPIEVLIRTLRVLLLQLLGG